MHNIAIQLISHLPVTPKFLIVKLADEDWPKFLWGNKYERIKIIRPYIGKDYRGPASIREVNWIRIDDLCATDKEDLINKLKELSE